MIWDEVGEDEFEREKVLVDLEHECLQIYRRKVDDANMSRARLHQELADSEAQFTHLILSLDDRSLPGRPEKLAGTLKEQLGAIAPALRKMQTRKAERMKQFRAVQLQIHKISAEIAGQSEYDDSLPEAVVNENDLSLKKLEEYQMKLQGLEADKSDRLERVKNYIIAIQNLSAMLGMDSSMIITKVHPSLNELSGLSKNMSDRILAKLNATVESLEAEKRSRIEKLHNLGNSLKNLWDLMDTPYIDRQLFSHILGSITSTNISAPGSLSITMIEQAEAEVERLDQLKASKMKELLVKKQTELEEICRRSHMEVPSLSKTDHIVNLINRAEDEASSRKMIMEKVEKWVLARDEERWLEEYTMDDKRYTVSRGAHKNLKRAERARAMVNKISGTFTGVDGGEKKITHSQVVVLHESVMLTRPTTGSRRQLDRSVDGGFKIRGSTGVQLVTNNVRSSYQNALKGSQGPKIFARARIDRHLREDQASGGSPFSLN
ncbi:Microtubule-associated protein, MAP65/Ase1/PRC1 [Cynara cardunculus var. scolymus]|uniref:Microtubule-associated protein, MAP65/Ase1/PRC1 n=1 Tax=Cynara cardunculus var. scolymus TaxID=59895 RepID=A0A103XVW5_CYNCS|nr:Microtubule-associated protein, MAP65/Ase1/PRC1 [Cynara cardunculus var. scolymus]